MVLGSTPSGTYVQSSSVSWSSISMQVCQSWVKNTRHCATCVLWDELFLPLAAQWLPRTIPSFVFPSFPWPGPLSSFLPSSCARPLHSCLWFDAVLGPHTFALLYSCSCFLNQMFCLQPSSPSSFQSSSSMVHPSSVAFWTYLVQVSYKIVPHSTVMDKYNNKIHKMLTTKRYPKTPDKIPSARFSESWTR